VSGATDEGAIADDGSNDGAKEFVGVEVEGLDNGKNKIVGTTDDDEETIDSILVDIAVGSQVGRIVGSSVLEGLPSCKSDDCEVDDNEGWVDIYSEIVEIGEGSADGRSELSIIL